MRGYSEDLAYIHDAGFSDFVLGAAPGLLRILKRCGVQGGLVVDLGCGSGRWARILNDAGYEAIGIDQSRAFLRLARRAAPRSRFVLGSLFRVQLPACDAITAMGECLNYAFDERAGPRELVRFFVRAHAALRCGGVLVFDLAEPGRVPEGGPRKSWSEGRDWAILVETSGDARRRTLTRRIVSFRKHGAAWRRSEEGHRLHLYEASRIAEALGAIGFRVQCAGAYGRMRLPAGMRAVIAIKK